MSYPTIWEKIFKLRTPCMLNWNSGEQDLSWFEPLVHIRERDEAIFPGVNMQLHWNWRWYSLELFDIPESTYVYKGKSALLGAEGGGLLWWATVRRATGANRDTGGNGGCCWVPTCLGSINQWQWHFRDVATVWWRWRLMWSSTRGVSARYTNQTSNIRQNNLYSILLNSIWLYLNFQNWTLNLYNPSNNIKFLQLDTYCDSCSPNSLSKPPEQLQTKLVFTK